MLARAAVLLTITGLLAWQYAGVPAEAECTGTVRDAQGPVAGASVRYKGTSQEAVTDAAGRFRLPRLPGRQRVTATKDGYFIAGEDAAATPLVLTLQPLPTHDCDRYAWVDPSPDPSKPLQCGNCHQAIHDEWLQSRHASSGRNPRFLKQYEQMLTEHPLGADVCASCHAPTLPPGGFGEFDMREAAKQPPGLSGIHCDYCHKVQGPGTGEFGLTHGRYQLSLLRPDMENDHRQHFFGSLPDVDRGDDIFSRFQRDSKLCAACHEGVVFGVPVYTTFSEWQASPAGKSGQSCQACHMAPTGKMTNIAPGHGGIRRAPETLGNHRMFDRDPIGMLRGCLNLKVSATAGKDEVQVKVSLTADDVGHAVPTGFIDRHLVLFIEGYAGDRDRTAYHGPTLPNEFRDGEAGRSGRSYARFLADGDGRRPARFWQADPATLVDTRLRPGVTDRLTFGFPPDVDRVRVRLVDRRSWQERDETVVFDRRIDLRVPSP